MPPRSSAYFKLRRGTRQKPVLTEGRIAVYEHRGTYSAMRDGMSVPGYYDSTEAAVIAARELEDALITLMLGDVYAIEGENRPVTQTDLEYVLARRHRLRVAS